MTRTIKVPVRAPYKKTLRQELEESSKSRPTSPNEASDAEDVRFTSMTTTSKKLSQFASAFQYAAVISMNEEVADVPAVSAPSRKQSEIKGAAFNR